MDYKDYYKLEGKQIDDDNKIMLKEIQDMQIQNYLFKIDNMLIDIRFKLLCDKIDDIKKRIDIKNASKSKEKHKKIGRPKLYTKEEQREKKKAYDIRYQKARYKMDLDYRYKKLNRVNKKYKIQNKI